MDMVNRQHRFFKEHISHHGSYDRDGIQDWCNLFSLIRNPHGNVIVAIAGFPEIVVPAKKTVRYRSMMGKSPCAID